MIRKIAFRKWTDPLGGANEYTPDDEYEVTRGREMPNSLLGPLPTEVYASLHENFNLFLVDTRFNVSRKVLEATAASLGIEHVKPTGRYGMHVKFAKLFSDKEIKDALAESLGATYADFVEENPGEIEIDEETEGFVIDMINKQHRKHDLWCILLLPNAEYHVKGLRKTEGKTFQEYIEKCRAVQDQCGGIVYYSVQESK